MTKARSFWGTQVTGPERAFFREAGSSPFGRSIIVSLLFASVIFSTGYLFPEQIYFGVSVHLLDAQAFPAALIIYLIFSRVAKSKPGFWLNVSFWLSTGFLSALAPNVVLFLLTAQTTPDLLSQTPFGIFAYSMLTAVVSIIFSGLRLSRSRFSALRKQRRLLDEISHELENQIVTMKGEIRDSVQGELSKALQALNELKDPKALSERLIFAIDDVIRPLSHRLAGFGLKATPPVIAQPVLTAIPRKRGVALARLAAPEIYSLFFLVFILPASFYIDGVKGLATAFSLLSVNVIFLTLIERFAKNVFVNRIVGMLLLISASTLIGLPYPFITQSDSESGIAVGFILTSIGVTGLMAQVSRRLDDMRELAYVNQELLSVVSVLRQEAWVTKTRLAKAIHGSVQAKFLSVALRLGASKQLSKEELAIAKGTIESSVAEVESSLSGHNAPFAEQFQTIEQAWDGVAKLYLKTEPKIVQKLDSLPVARTCVLEVISEAVANAAKHSKAPSMDIELQENSLGQIVVSVWSAGKLANESGRKGYGSQMLDEVTVSWSLTNLKGRVYLKAVIQLQK